MRSNFISNEMCRVSFGNKAVKGIFTAAVWEMLAILKL